ncbi:MAG: hypothetical protein WDN00_18605 [Limisphaerales bacterium]
MLASSDTNLNALSASIGVTLDNVAGITSNLKRASAGQLKHPLGESQDGDGFG